MLVTTEAVLALASSAAAATVEDFSDMDFTPTAVCPETAESSVDDEASVRTPADMFSKHLFQVGAHLV